jgi:hypothetical protein
MLQVEPVEVVECNIRKEMKAERFRVEKSGSIVLGIILPHQQPQQAQH